MSDVTTEETGEETEDTATVFRSYGVGVGLDAIAASAELTEVFDGFKAKQAELNEAKAVHDRVNGERNDMIRELKEKHNIGFSAMAEVTETSSSNVLYLYERSKGLSAKEIKALSRASNATRQANRVDNPDAKPSRKQSPAEKQFRKQQREQLKAFMVEERERLAAAGEDTSELDEGIAASDAEQAADDADG